MRSLPEAFNRSRDSEQAHKEHIPKAMAVSGHTVLPHRADRRYQPQRCRCPFQFTNAGRFRPFLTRSNSPLNEQSAAPDFAMTVPAKPHGPLVLFDGARILREADGGIITAVANSSVAPLLRAL